MNFTVEEYLSLFTGDALQQMVKVAKKDADSEVVERELPKIKEALAIKKAEDDAAAKQWRKDHKDDEVDF